MESPLCPRLDQGLSTLLEDLHQRGLLVIDAGGRHRRVRPNAADQQVRRPRSLAAVLLGAAGRRRRSRRAPCVGASDHQGGYPADRPVSVPELAATLYRLLGIDTTTDPRMRPFIGDAAPVMELI